MGSPKGTFGNTSRTTLAAAATYQRPRKSNPRLRQCNSRNNNLIGTQLSWDNIPKMNLRIPRLVRLARLNLSISESAPSRRIPGASHMQRMTIVAIATMLATAPAFAQGADVAGSGTAPPPAKPATAAPAGAAPPAPITLAKPPVAPSKPNTPSAAAFWPYDETT